MLFGKQYGLIYEKFKLSKLIFFLILREIINILCNILMEL